MIWLTGSMVRPNQSNPKERKGNRRNNRTPGAQMHKSKSPPSHTRGSPKPEARG